MDQQAAQSRSFCLITPFRSSLPKPTRHLFHDAPMHDGAPPRHDFWHRSSRSRPGQHQVRTAVILFLHGWRSTPGGVKPTYLRDHAHTVLNSALPDDDFDAAVRIAKVEFGRHHPDVVIGSSRGGAVAMAINSGATPLVLLSPTWKRWGKATKVKPRTVILHSRADDVVPFAARTKGKPGCRLRCSPRRSPSRTLLLFSLFPAQIVSSCDGISPLWGWVA